MTEPLYFQWQNEFLLKTIYPMREVKLRDFLVSFAEIDIWSAYKDRDIASLQDEVKAFNAAQASGLVARISIAVKSARRISSNCWQPAYKAILQPCRSKRSSAAEPPIRVRGQEPPLKAWWSGNS